MTRPSMTPGPRRLRDFDRSGYNKGRSVVQQALWVLASHLVVQAWYTPRRLRVSVLRMFGARIGRRVVIRSRVRVHWPWKLTIGDDAWIGEGAWLMNLEPIVIENDACISQEAFLITGSHRAEDPRFRYDNGPISIGAGAWVCARAVVLRGVALPAGTVVPAGQVVSRGALPGATGWSAP